MAALEEVLKTSFIIFCLLGISLSIENGKLHKIHIYIYIYWITAFVILLASSRKFANGVVLFCL
jgi:hypothetical protein